MSKQILFPILAIFISTIIIGCSSKKQNDEYRIVDISEAYVNSIEEEDYEEEIEEIDSADNSKVHSIRVKRIGRLGSVFNDKNPLHLAAAFETGHEPISDLKGAFDLNKPIEKVVGCDEFFIDDLTHSLPYLRPHAHKLLKQIGRNFTDTIMARCGKKYKIKVTSILRTSESVTRLKRRNSNATDSSAHQYGTTFDISYVKFIDENPNYILSQESLKNALGEILYDLREQGLCYVKYERKQGCFHITAR